MNRLPHYLPHALALLLPVAAAALLAMVGNSHRPLVPDWEEELLAVRLESVTEAEALFARLNYAWPPLQGPTVPRIAVDPLPDDYHAGLETQRKKALFFRVLLPMVLAENRVLRAQRRHLQRLLADGLPAADTAPREWLQGLLRRYRIAEDGDLELAAARLLQRLDEIPTALVLAQAANESAWGTSRFTRVANNLFGQWTWQAEHGIVPASRPEGERYLVRKFPSLRDSVRDYLYNLNVGHAYEGLRRLRHEMRRTDQPLDATILAAGLSRYSERGDAYVEEIRRIIRGNGLERLSEVDLMPPAAVRQVALLAEKDESTGG